jgi:hypothetical protein
VKSGKAYVPVVCEQWESLCALLCEKELMCVNSEKACAHVVCERAYVCEQWQRLCALCVRKSLCL